MHSLSHTSTAVINETNVDKARAKPPNMRNSIFSVYKTMLAWISIGFAVCLSVIVLVTVLLIMFTWRPSYNTYNLVDVDGTKQLGTTDVDKILVWDGVKYVRDQRAVASLVGGNLIHTFDFLGTALTPNSAVTPPAVPSVTAPPNSVGYVIYLLPRLGYYSTATQSVSTNGRHFVLVESDYLRLRYTGERTIVASANMTSTFTTGSTTTLFDMAVGPVINSAVNTSQSLTTAYATPSWEFANGFFETKVDSTTGTTDAYTVVSNGFIRLTPGSEISLGVWRLDNTALYEATLLALSVEIREDTTGLTQIVLQKPTYIPPSAGGTTCTCPTT